MKIQKVSALEVLDSRGNPTVRAFVQLEDGRRFSASVPSGASTGTHEAVELRDDDKSRYGGKGVQKAVGNVNTVINETLVGMEVSDPRTLDAKMLELDGTENKSKLGANAILSVSMSVVRAAAAVEGVPLWKFINTYFMKGGKVGFPRPMVNVVNGGVHAGWNFDIQEFMIVPKATTPSESLRVASEMFHSLGKVLKSKKLQTLVGDEGGYSPALSSNEEVLATIHEAAESIGRKVGVDFDFALDVASSEFYENGKYVLKKDNRELSGDDLIQYYNGLLTKYPIISFEDPFAEDDWGHFTKFTSVSDGRYIVVGDDLYVTNPKRLQKGIDEKAGNAILVKVNQIGSVSETIDAIQLARKAEFSYVISHRSGETEDSFIADLCYGTAANYIKTGSMSRSDRLAKYNRLLEIEAGY